eukprot:273986-Amphidinium_carterae.1
MSDDDDDDDDDDDNADDDDDDDDDDNADHDGWSSYAVAAGAASKFILRSMNKDFISEGVKLECNDVGAASTMAMGRYRGQQNKNSHNKWFSITQQAKNKWHHMPHADPGCSQWLLQGDLDLDLDVLGKEGLQVGTTSDPEEARINAVPRSSLQDDDGGRFSTA